MGGRFQCPKCAQQFDTKQALREGFAAEDAVMNTSQIHMDCMIGHAGIHVTGIGSDGQRVPIMVDGEFVI